MENIYVVKQLRPDEQFTVTVPGSKSITNRALMLAALADGKCMLHGVLFSDDSRAFLDCLLKLGFNLDIDEEAKTVTIEGTSGDIPNKCASINVRSAGTAARFLTVMLAAAGGEYYVDSSEQMKKRPMEPLITILRNAGVDIICLGEEGHFPFEMHSNGINVNEVSVDTEVSSQFASALLMAGSMVEGGLEVKLTGSRTEGSYIKITTTMLNQFGVKYNKKDSSYLIDEQNFSAPENYVIEPDISAACYFWGIAAINSRKITVRHVRLGGMQGDLKFLDVLKQMGCEIGEEKDGVWVKGTSQLNGISVDMKDFSDQTMTLAAIAPFADSDTEIKNISHIRKQESDRLTAVVNELNRMGISANSTKENNQEGIYIRHGAVKPTHIHTYEDHRMAMAFAITGTKVEGICIINPQCCAKTFENYFDVLDEITC